MTIGDKIRLLRTEKKISIRKMADITGLSKSTLSDIENNKSKKPTIDTIGRIAKALEVPISELLSESDPQAEEQNENIGDVNTNQSEIFLRSVARAKERPKETQERIAAFINLLLDQEEKGE
ncbi:MAG: helix-turn-helix transcriptional regulator [Thermoanaerobacteraceae bacterium]|nr:helix-turn-helix transcriptional regulator [Thermoanaerobacteraceae bacterium]HHT63798.1 helix-turn-helix transcriptional regulator [Clostridia bacterium]